MSLYLQQCENSFKIFIRGYFAIRNKPIVKSHEGGFVDPRDEVRRLIKLLRKVRREMKDETNLLQRVQCCTG